MEERKEREGRKIRRKGKGKENVRRGKVEERKRIKGKKGLRIAIRIEREGKERNIYAK